LEARISAKSWNKNIAIKHMFEEFLRQEKVPKHRVEKFHHNIHLGSFSSVGKLTKSQV
jgi:hypothetical protein